jgi:shikimate dehydrogenase
MSRQLAVVGHPIKHSKSPVIHEAAYRVLGLDWKYLAIDISEGRLLQFLETLDHDWIGLSVTMPLKFEATRSSSELVGFAELTGVTNTLLRINDVWRGYNTDVLGLQLALGDKLIADSSKVLILGSGASAISAAFAVLAKNPKAEVTLAARDLEAAKQVELRVERSGYRLKVCHLRKVRKHMSISQLIISTLPSEAFDKYLPKLENSIFFKPRGVLLEIAYAAGSSQLASVWKSRGLAVISGVEMLIHQAIAQIRLFTSGELDTELPNERAVELAMRDALGLL